jgi:hypothetical protein
VDLDVRPVHAPGLVAVAIDGETIVVDEGETQLHHLDAMATAVWGHLDGESSLRDICLSLADAFGVGLSKVQADVVGLVERLLVDGLIEVRRPVGPL